MSRVLLFSLLVVCLGCGSAPKAEEKAAPVEAAKVDAPKADAPKGDNKITASPAAPGAPPENIYFPSEYGNVTYTHQKHIERLKAKCDTCHPSVFPQALEPLGYGKARHRDAEEFKKSCATCHGINGTAFAAERNCQKCHDMAAKH